jgi:hypothetical protein
LVFYYEVELRPALKELASDSFVAVRAREFLSLIGVPEDLRYMMQLTPPLGDPEDPFKNRWRYSAATALLHPDSDDEWSFLRMCSLNEFEDRWVAAGAIQTLKLIGSPRSKEILEEVRAQDGPRSGAAAEALEYIRLNPGAPIQRDLEALAAQAAQVVKVGTWLGNSKPRYNKVGDKALVDLQFHSGFDGLTYTATFHSSDGGVWMLMGVRETLQEFAP